MRRQLSWENIFYPNKIQDQTLTVLQRICLLLLEMIMTVQCWLLVTTWHFFLLLLCPVQHFCPVIYWQMINYQTSFYWLRHIFCHYKRLARKENGSMTLTYNWPYQTRIWPSKIITGQTQLEKNPEFLPYTRYNATGFFGNSLLVVSFAGDVQQHWDQWWGGHLHEDSDRAYQGCGGWEW